MQTLSSQLGSDVSEELILKAVELLKSGQLVAFPTETVYGLGADASNQQAIVRLYEAKGRPSSHPVIVHVHDLAKVVEWAVAPPPALDKLARRFWPGPLTVVLKKRPHVSDSVTGGQDTVAVRVPSHPLALRLLKSFNGGVVAPSANKFGRLSPTRASDVVSEFGDQVQLVLDGGPCNVGIESTILDLSRSQPCILRPGMITALELEECIGQRVELASGVRAGGEVRVPGALPSHYAPCTPVVLCSAEQLGDKLAELLSGETAVALYSFEHPGLPATDNLIWKQSANNAELFARELYRDLRELDNCSVDWIVIVEPPSTESWYGVNDRLRRAAAAKPKREAR